MRVRPANASISKVLRTVPSAQKAKDLLNIKYSISDTGAIRLLVFFFLTLSYMPYSTYEHDLGEFKNSVKIKT